ncbi:unnamed protein product [Miscanthus lutarioriparius]|uniref:Uncharacterized protein n=1 Tax=Miscanthus lutarioriparius TaxID=422564 RepID=A0A811NTX2_9POAL|nr:unnamed protein product [Miscanthus lutarioriparius]
MASLHPGSPGLGARPRPMDPQRLFHLVQDGGCLLQLFSKPAGDELWSTCGWRHLASGDGRRRWNPEDLGCKGSKD